MQVLLGKGSMDNTLFNGVRFRYKSVHSGNGNCEDRLQILYILHFPVIGFFVQVLPQLCFATQVLFYDGTRPFLVKHEASPIPFMC